jgi:hypothetical protein
MVSLELPTWGGTGAPPSRPAWGMRRSQPRRPAKGGLKRSQLTDGAGSRWPRSRRRPTPSITSCCPRPSMRSRTASRCRSAPPCTSMQAMTTGPAARHSPSPGCAASSPTGAPWRQSRSARLGHRADQLLAQRLRPAPPLHRAPPRLRRRLPALAAAIATVRALRRAFCDLGGTKLECSPRKARGSCAGPAGFQASPPHDWSGVRPRCRSRCERCSLGRGP